MERKRKKQMQTFRIEKLSRYKLFVFNFKRNVSQFFPRNLRESIITTTSNDKIFSCFHSYSKLQETKTIDSKKLKSNRTQQSEFNFLNSKSYSSWCQSIQQKYPSKSLYFPIHSKKICHHQRLSPYRTPVFASKSTMSGGDGPGEKEELKLLMASMKEELTLLLENPELRLNWGRIGGYIEEISSASTSCPIEIYNIAILACSMSQKADEAKELLDRLGGQGLRPSHMSFAAAMFGSAVNGEWKSALEILDSMQLHRLHADSLCYNIAIMGCGKAKQDSMVTDIIKELIDKEIPWNEITRSIIVAAYSRNGDWKSSFSHLIDSKGSKESKGGGIKFKDGVDIVACNAALAACTRSEKDVPVQNALALFNAMALEKENVKPNLSTFNEIIYILGKNGDADAATDYLKQLMNSTDEDGNKMHPNHASFRGLFLALAKQGKVDEILELIGEMEIKGIVPDVLNYTETLETLGQSNNAAGAFAILPKMRGAPQPDYRIYVESLAKVDELLEEALIREVLKDLNKIEITL